MTFGNFICNKILDERGVELVFQAEHARDGWGEADEAANVVAVTGSELQF